MLQIEYTTQFKRDLKLAKRRRNNLDLLEKIIEIIANQKTIPAKYKDRSLRGHWQGFRELHLQPDWLLIYEILPQEKTVVFVRVGTHADLFN